jgi:hypothetical protein
MDVPAGRTSRRRLLGATAIAGALGVSGRSWAVATAQDGPTPTAEIGAAAMPSWAFRLLALQDPYPGQVQVPASPPPGTRYVAAEVVVDNGADQPLAFTPSDVRLRDATGVEYRGGTAIGTEPAINVRNLNGGERSRGWVWFTVAVGAELVDVVYVAPPPQLRIPLPPRSGA